MKIFDCFAFYNEFDILEMRLTEMWDFVDRFVLVESKTTHKGKPKELFFQDNKARFHAYRDKIIHIVVDEMPKNENPWVLENYQRNQITRGLFEASDDDVILISDVDEIIRKSALKRTQNCSSQIVGFRMILSYFKTNYVCMEGECHAVWAVGARAKLVRKFSPQHFRDRRNHIGALENVGDIFDEIVSVIPHAGWHFSYLGSKTDIRNKIDRVLHDELNIPNYIESDIDNLILSGRDLYDRPGYKWLVVQLNDYFPEVICNNTYKYSEYIAEGAQIALPISA